MGDASSGSSGASPRRAFARAGERRRGALELLLAPPPVATRNGLTLPSQTGAPSTQDLLSAFGSEGVSPLGPLPLILRTDSPSSAIR